MAKVSKVNSRWTNEYPTQGGTARMWRGKKVAVILPTVNERETIRAAALGYFATGFVDEVIVVNNNAVHGTSQEIVGTGAREIFERRRGYGNAIFCGIDHSDADILILSTPDGTFDPGDTGLLLAHFDQVPVVFGTRTVRNFTPESAQTGAFLRFSNWAIAKLTQFLFRTTPLTDMGCALRLLDREALMHVRPHLSARNSRFDQQLLLEVISHGIPFVEVPVRYRADHSKTTITFARTLKRGVRMVALLMEHRLGLVPCSHLPWRPESRGPHAVELQTSLTNLTGALGRPVPVEPEARSADHFRTDLDQTAVPR